MKWNTKNITEAKEGLEVYKNRYWLCVDGDPQKALFFGKSPQCNGNKSIQEWALKQDQYAKQGNLEIVFVETAFVPIRN